MISNILLHYILWFFLLEIIGGGGGQYDMFASPISYIFTRGRLPPPPLPPGSTPLGRNEKFMNPYLRNLCARVREKYNSGSPRSYRWFIIIFLFLSPTLFLPLSRSFWCDSSNIIRRMITIEAETPCTHHGPLLTEENDHGVTGKTCENVDERVIIIRRKCEAILYIILFLFC